MAKVKIAVEYDEERFSVYGEGKLLVSVPACVVRKKSAYPVAEAVGAKAFYEEKKVPEGYLFVRPFEGSKIVDVPGAKLLIRSTLRKLFGRSSFYQFCILIETGLSREERAKIERIFMVSGFKNVYLVEKPYLLAKIGQKRGVEFVVDMGARQTEAVTCRNGKIVKAYTLDVGFAKVGEVITDKMCEENNLSVCSIKQPEEICSFLLNEQKRVPILSYCSLFRNDYSRLIGKGLDIISGEYKDVFSSSKELFSIVSKPYEKTCELIATMLMPYSMQELNAILTNGIFYVGKGTEINGFDEYMFDKTQIFVSKTRNRFYELKELFTALEDKEFLMNSLGIKE